MNALPAPRWICGERLRRLVEKTGEPMAYVFWEFGFLNSSMRRALMPSDFPEKLERICGMPVAEVECSCGSYSKDCDGAR